tara:strand:- start:498 stop:686 length:189 start_codon:yes stop_codon:yes gene_type:complete
MKYWITEYVSEDPKIIIGPYIKAETIIQAEQIAILYDLIVVGEIKELIHEPIIKIKESKTIH